MSGPDHNQLNPEGVPDGGGVPPMAQPGAQSFVYEPIHIGPQRALGMRIGRRGKGHYVLASNWSDAGRNARRFPLSEDGWQQAWQAFAAEDPAGAAAYGESLRARGQLALLDERNSELARQGAERLRHLPRLADVSGCTLIGGYRYEGLRPDNSYNLYFVDDRVLLTPFATTAVVAEIEYAETLALRVDGPGAITQGGGFIGGGFGFGGAAEGMVIASVLNRLTTRTTIQTLIEVQDRTRDFIFFYDKETPQQLRLRVRPVEARLRQTADERERQRLSPQATFPDPVERLERLAQLHKQGALTDDEFESAKRDLLNSLSES